MQEVWWTPGQGSEHFFLPNGTFCPLTLVLFSLAPLQHPRATLISQADVGGTCCLGILRGVQEDQQTGQLHISAVLLAQHSGTIYLRLLQEDLGWYVTPLTGIATFSRIW
jgi:hypothetical protein